MRLSVVLGSEENTADCGFAFEISISFHDSAGSARTQIAAKTNYGQADLGPTRMQEQGNWRGAITGSLNR